MNCLLPKGQECYRRNYGAPIVTQKADTPRLSATDNGLVGDSHRRYQVAVADIA